MEASYGLVRYGPSRLKRTFSPTFIRPERAPYSKHYGTLREHVRLLLIRLSACPFTPTRPRRYLSPGTQSSVHPWSIQRDACNFVFHDTFQPERWLAVFARLPLSAPRAQGVLASVSVHNADAFVVFGCG